MSIRRQLYDLLASLTDRDPALRVTATAAYLDGLAPDEVPGAERRMLAVAQVYLAAIGGGLGSGDFLAAVYEAERKLVN